MSVAKDIIEIISSYLSESWLSRNKISLTPDLDLRTLELDPIDECILNLRIEKRFNLRHLPNREEWFTNVGEIEAFIKSCSARPATYELARKFFRDIWEPSIKFYQFSSDNLIEEVNRLKPTLVLDLGCGYHYFKDKINNLVGIDIINPNADLLCDFLDFNPSLVPFDAILALGSINFGKKEDIIKMLRHARDMLSPKGKIFLRVNPGLLWPEFPELPIYPWSLEKIYEHGQEVGLQVDGAILEDPGLNGIRYAFVYKHSGT